MRIVSRSPDVCRERPLLPLFVDNVSATVQDSTDGRRTETQETTDRSGFMFPLY